jgi:hypothetical protein
VTLQLEELRGCDKRLAACMRVFSLLQDRIEFTLFCQQQQLQRLSAAMVIEAGHYASLAVLSAHPGFTVVSGGITSPFWAWFDEPLNLNQPIRAWFSAPFHLRIQDCEAASRRVADTNLSATVVPTVSPTFATPMPSPDDGECSTFEDLAAALTQLAPETADGSLPVPTNATQPTAPSFGPTAPQTQGPSTSNAKRPESTTTSCRDTHVRRNKASKNQNQDCEAAFRRVADTNLSATAVPTVAPTLAATSPGDTTDRSEPSTLLLHR